ncbi:MAG: CRISPR-associated endonuclease Cas2 [Planctomycetes bacterium]|nr:CRISPR-associated endonuclease Cas2 [Planctomycetota bacterium]
MKHYFLITYDVADPKRLRKVMKTVRGYGDRVQYSVFLGQLSEKDEAILRGKLKDKINHSEDQVILIRLGPVDGSSKSAPDNWKILGVPYEVKDYSVMVY